MREGLQRGFTAVEKTELWDRWQHGESTKVIGRAFDKHQASIYFQLAPFGGIRPTPRRRSRLALTLSEREEISRGIAGQRSLRSIATLLGRAPSTVSREISHNGGYDQYRATQADEQAWANASQALFSGFQEFLTPTVIHILIQSFPTTQLGDTFFSSHAFQYNSDLFFGGILLTGTTAYIFN